jgi:hypothetical protein
MRSSRTFTIAVMLVAAAIAAGEEIPERVAARLDTVVNPSEPDEFQGSFTMSVATVVQKPNGSSREEVVFEAEVANTTGAEQTRRLIRYLENGVDVTEEQRQEFESRKPSDTAEDEDDLANPFGETAGLYTFASPETLGSEVVAPFGPAPGHEDDDNVATGRLAWDPATLEPLWMEMTAVHAPKPLKRLATRLEFRSVGDTIYVSRMVTDGLARVLLMQREFHMDLRFDDIRPANPIEP